MEQWTFHFVIEKKERGKCEKQFLTQNQHTCHGPGQNQEKPRAGPKSGIISARSSPARPGPKILNFKTYQSVSRRSIAAKTFRFQELVFHQ